tara:strand:- start:633 stop:1127 length:495 start_codon:yes stop_codon:yes gene_type:complete
MRCIYLSVADINPEIQKFRERNDPIWRLIEPHITLVFPFDSAISDEELIEHVETKVVSTSSFKASLCPQPTIDSGYIYFPILLGNGQISALHDRLYEGLMSKHLQDRPYVPHITVGRGNGVQAKLMAEEASTISVSNTFNVNKVLIEKIGATGESKTIKAIWLK